MDSLHVSRFLQKLSFLHTVSKHQVFTYLSLLQARNYAHSTVSAVARIIRKFVLTLPQQRQDIVTDNLARATSQDIDSFIDSARSKGLSPSTINTNLSVLKEFFDFLLEQGQMQAQPVIRRRHRLFAPFALPKPMAESDLIEFFKVIDSVRDRLIFLLMLRCGLRVSEVCHLTWSDIDFEAGQSASITARVRWIGSPISHPI
jgi:site-specific recombinase XerD